MHEVEINTDRKQLDISFVNGFISNSHWAKGRTNETMQTCIDHSLNFGVYLQNKQVGFARVVTDYVVLAYIMDLFIDENYRGRGYSKKLMSYMMTCRELKNIQVWRLATTDAHGLYKQFGFKTLSHPENLMELRK